jgi:peroxiredoxin (alkyl hydroperoxide reductase subunit C)
MALVGKKAPLFDAAAVINGDEMVDHFSLEQ